ncbi:MAG: SET domain-containing protein [Candidatus Dadabacteria bacterium]
MSLKQLSFLLDGVYVGGTKKMGRGVYTRTAIAEGEIVEVAPVIVMTAKDRTLLDQTLLHDYIFEWGEQRNQCCMALGLVPIYNHSYQANCEYEMYFGKEVITIKTVRAVAAGEELFINYNGDWDSEKKVWFEVV